MATSSVVAAALTGLISGRLERRKQLLESRRTLGGDFAGQSMAVLAALRHVKPPTSTGHRNFALHRDAELRARRAEVVTAALDELRALRGRVWLTFPGRSEAGLAIASPRTTADWAERVVRDLRDIEETCATFWTKCDAAREEDWPAILAEYDHRYDLHRNEAWRSLNSFADSASSWLKQSFLLRDVAPPEGMPSQEGSEAVTT